MYRARWMFPGCESRGREHLPHRAAFVRVIVVAAAVAVAAASAWAMS